MNWVFFHREKIFDRFYLSSGGIGEESKRIKRHSSEAKNWKFIEWTWKSFITWWAIKTFTKEKENFLCRVSSSSQLLLLIINVINQEWNLDNVLVMLEKFWRVFMLVKSDDVVMFENKKFRRMKVNNISVQLSSI
jgi:hypothetical protein